MRTITVEGHFGKDKEITESKFIATWTNHANELVRLTPSAPYSEVQEIVEKAREWATAEFNRIYAEQQKEK